MKEYLDKPAVKEVDGLSVPAVFGLWNPTICLPPGTAETLSANELAWVLSHELSHIKRRDAWLLTIATLARALHWFNPIMHLAFSRLRLYVEQAADDLAVDIGTSSEEAFRAIMRREFDVFEPEQLRRVDTWIDSAYILFATGSFCDDATR